MVWASGERRMAKILFFQINGALFANLSYFVLYNLGRFGKPNNKNPRCTIAVQRGNKQGQITCRGYHQG